jgi:hypothetical protein
MTLTGPRQLKFESDMPSHAVGLGAFLGIDEQRLPTGD